MFRLRKIIILSFLLLLHGSFSQAQQDVFKTMATGQLKSQTDFLISAGKYQEVIPFIEELLKRLEDSTDQNTISQVERLRYMLAYAYFTQGDLAAATIQFEEYLKKHKDQNILRTTMALDMLANCFFSQGQYDQAVPRFEEMLASRHTPHDRRRTAKMLLGECFVRLKDWNKAIPLLEEMLRDSSDLEAQGRAAVFLCQGYIELDKAERVFEILPLLEESGSLARYSVEFNLAVLAGADRLMLDGKLDLALPLFLVVAPKRLIENWLNEQTEEIESDRETAKKLGPQGMTTVLNLTSKLKQLEEQREALAGTTSYDEELRARIAQAYFRQGRKWEALWVYDSLIEDFPDTPHAEEAAYAGFALAGTLGMMERAIEFGEQYLERFPKGEQYEDVAYQLCQLYLQAKIFPKVAKVARLVLDSRPDTIFGDRLLFLTGYSLFLEEQFDEAAEMFVEVRKRFPDSESRKDADYWYAMTFLFKGDYKQALDQFRLVAEQHSDSPGGVDAKFREAVCLYALENYPEAKAKLEDFVVHFPQSPQIAEANILLGDIAGNDGRLDDGLKYYQRVESLTLNQSQIDYANMQMGKILDAQEKWEDMASLFTRYFATYGTKGLYTEAIYRIGQAKKNQGDIDGMLTRYLSALTTYGNDRKAIGLDLILRDWMADYTQHYGTAPTEIISKELEKASKLGQESLALRWRMALDKAKLASGEKTSLPSFAPEDFSNASAAVLIWMAEKSAEANQTDLARKAYQTVLEDFPETEWNESALLNLARMSRKEGDNESAISYYKRLRELFPSSDSAALAYEEEAEIHIEQKEYKEGIALFELILEVKEWRGEIWARALYKIGEAKLAQGNPEEAFGYFQRVYVLYSYFKEWTAKAYLQSAKCLAALGKFEERSKTLKEFISSENFKEFSEYNQAVQLLAKGETVK